MSTSNGYGEFGRAHLAGWIPPMTNTAPKFDAATTTASALQDMLAAGKVSSVDILHEYYRQILFYNDYLKAVYRLTPSAIERAKELDARRSAGDVLGPLHGIPVLLKDNIATEPSMELDNTGGTLGLVGSMPKMNAPLVDKLVAAGAIIMGKATLSELMWFKGPGIRCGWAALHGQSQNPYIVGGVDMSDGAGGHSSPGGSSSGPAIAVAASFAPLAIGTDTEGSLISPATRQGCYSFKPALGSVSNSGIIPVSTHLDVAGPIANCVKDTVDVLSIIVDSEKTKSAPAGYNAAMMGNDGWKQLRIGTLDPEKWRYDSGLQTPNPEAIDQIKAATLGAYDRIKGLAKAYHYDVSLRPDSDFLVDGKNSLVELMLADFEKGFDDYISGTTNSKVTSAKQLVEWNKTHAKEVLPSEYPTQELLEKAIAYDHAAGKREKIIAAIDDVGKSLPETLEKYDIDIIIGPSDSWFTKYSAGTGLPSCALPLGHIDYNGRPIGLCGIGGMRPL